MGEGEFPERPDTKITGDLRIMLNISIVLYHPKWEQEVLPLVTELLKVHHLRKMGDETDPFNRLSGTAAIAGAADTMIVLSKEILEDMLDTFNRKKNAAFEFCEAELFLATDESGKVVGRVAAIINHKANKTWQTRNVRFG